MSKLFGVDTTKKAQAPSETHHTHYLVGADHDDLSHGDETDHDSLSSIHHDVAEGHESYIHHETDIGQIAVDVLDLAEEIIIIAPIA
jgi:hypothetical protein